jgi:hypothetical protein
MMRKQSVKDLLQEAKITIREAKELVYHLLNEPMAEEQKQIILKLFRLLK